MTCAYLYVGPSFLLIYWSCPLALPLGLPCLRGLPLWVWLGLFGSLPPWFSFCGVGWFFAGLFAPLVWSGCLGIPTPWSRLFPLGLCSRSSWRAFVVGLLPWLPPLSALSIWGQFRSKFTLFPNLPHIFARQRWMWRTCAGSGCSRHGPAHAGLLHDLALKKWKINGGKNHPTTFK